MFGSFLITIRDTLLIILLFFLVKVALQRTTEHIKSHAKSIIHELDRTFLDQLYMAKRQLHQLEEHTNGEDSLLREIHRLQEEIISIENQYKTNSPAIMLLGPIGSAAIVTKEEKLERKLLTTLNKLSILLGTISGIEDLSVSNTIDSALELNKQLLRKIIIQ